MKQEPTKIELFKYLEDVFLDLEQQKIALDNSAIVVITDTKGNITYVNDKFCQISQYSREELIGQNHSIINSGYHSPDFFKELWLTICSGKVWSGDIKNRTKDGSFYWVSTTIVPYINESGKPYQFVSIRFDITKQKNQELDLKARTRQLEDFCFIVSHNLRSPLSNLQVLTSMIKNSETYEESRMLIDKIEKPVNILNETFNELVESLQIRQDTTIEKDVLLFNECLDKVMETLSIGLQESDFELHTDFTSTPCIKYPKKYLISYLHNLIGNSIRYRSHERKLKIDVKSYCKNNNLYLEVKDNGIGIDMKNNGHKLFGLRKTFHGNPDAKGLGLFITKTQVETMGGQIYAESEFGKGSTFIIQFTKN